MIDILKDINRIEQIFNLGEIKMTEILIWLTSNPWLVTAVLTSITGGLGVLAKVKGGKYKKYSDVLVTAIETAEDSKNVKNMVSSLVDKHEKIKTEDFSGYVKEVVKNVTGKDVSQVVKEVKDKAVKDVENVVTDKLKDVLNEVKPKNKTKKSK